MYNYYYYYNNILTSSSPFFFGDSLKRSSLDFGFQLTSQTFKEVGVKALWRPVNNVHFGLVDVVLHQEQSMFWVTVMSEDKDQTQFCC